MHRNSTCSSQTRCGPSSACSKADMCTCYGTWCCHNDSCIKDGDGAVVFKVIFNKSCILPAVTALSCLSFQEKWCFLGDTAGLTKWVCMCSSCHWHHRNIYEQIMLILRSKCPDDSSKVLALFSLIFLSSEVCCLYHKVAVLSVSSQSLKLKIKTYFLVF